jgi:hypothetical protein
MTRHIRFLIATLVIAMCPFSLQAKAAQENAITPETSVTAFYTWFFKHDNDQTYPLRESMIYSYVSKKTVERLNSEYDHGGPPQGVDYFLKVQDYDPRDWAKNISVHSAIFLGDAAVVPVTFGSTNKTSVLVFLRKQEGRWKITKIDDTCDYK